MRWAPARGKAVVRLVVVRAGHAGGRRRAAVGIAVTVATTVGRQPEGPHRHREMGDRGRKPVIGCQLGGGHRLMTGGAGSRAVGPGEGKARGGMVFDGEATGDEACRVVARRAGAAVGSRTELPEVDVGVAGGAALETGDRAQWLAGCMAALAGGPAMATGERETGAVVIEAGAVHPLPAGGRMAGSALPAETGTVGIVVAVGAGRRQASIDHFARISTGAVAVTAGDLAVAAGEGKAGAAMIETRRGTPYPLP